MISLSWIHQHEFKRILTYDFTIFFTIMNSYMNLWIHVYEEYREIIPENHVYQCSRWSPQRILGDVGVFCSLCLPQFLYLWPFDGPWIQTPHSFPQDFWVKIFLSKMEFRRILQELVKDQSRFLIQRFVSIYIYIYIYIIQRLFSNLLL